MGWPFRHSRRHRSLTIEIRLAAEADLPYLPAIERAAADAFVGRDIPFEAITGVTPAEAWRPALDAGTLWIADDGEPVGFLGATRHGRRLHIDEFDIRPSHQGRGLGRRMLGEVIGWARGEGLESLSLTTFAHIPWNAPFYASCGFIALGEDLPADLGAVLAAETARGLPNGVAMRLSL